MKIIKPLFFQCLASVIMVACTQAKEVSERQDNSLLLSDNIEFALAQVGNQIEIIEASGEVLNPVTVRDDGSIY